LHGHQRSISDVWLIEYFLDQNPLISVKYVSASGTEQNRLERKTEFTILDGVWTKNGQMANYSPEKLSFFCFTQNVLTVSLKERIPIIIGMRME